MTEVGLEPPALGLDLLCRGLRRISLDDTTALERATLPYEALYVALAVEGSVRAFPTWHIALTALVTAALTKAGSLRPECLSDVSAWRLYRRWRPVLL